MPNAQTAMLPIIKLTDAARLCLQRHCLFCPPAGRFRMSALDILIHLANFVTPALALALLLPLAARLASGVRRGAPSWWLQVAVNFAVGTLALGLSLWGWGRDGKMAAYGALALAMATSQWLLSRGWR